MGEGCRRLSQPPSSWPSPLKREGKIKNHLEDVMAVSSTMLPLGSKIPDFRVLDVVSEKWRTPADFSEYPLLLVMFICRHCPYVLHVKDQLVRLGVDYVPKKVGIIAISSNDAVKYPDDAPAHLKEMTQELKFNFPLAYDESQETAKAFRAACTP